MDTSKTIGQIVAEDFRTSRIFRKNGLDFCCGGGKTLQAACAAKGLDASALSKELDEVLQSDESAVDFRSWSDSLLIDYILDQHHSFVKVMLPELVFYAQKVASRHGSNNPFLKEIERLILVLEPEMTDHLRKEEEELFPRIREGASPGIRRELMNMLEEEHESAGQIMAELEEITDGFQPPQGACASWQVLYKNLALFQEDLHKHVHLENNILFPRVIANA